MDHHIYYIYVLYICIWHLYKYGTTNQYYVRSLDLKSQHIPAVHGFHMMPYWSIGRLWMSKSKCYHSIIQRESLATTIFRSCSKFARHWTPFYADFLKSWLQFITFIHIIIIMCIYIFNKNNNKWQKIIILYIYISLYNHSPVILPNFSIIHYPNYGPPWDCYSVIFVRYCHIALIGPRNMEPITAMAFWKRGIWRPNLSGHWSLSWYLKFPRFFPCWKPGWFIVTSAMKNRKPSMCRYLVAFYQLPIFLGRCYQGKLIEETTG